MPNKRNVSVFYYPQCAIFDLYSEIYGAGYIFCIYNHGLYTMDN